MILRGMVEPLQVGRRGGECPAITAVVTAGHAAQYKYQDGHYESSEFHSLRM